MKWRPHLSCRRGGASFPPHSTREESGRGPVDPGTDCPDRPRPHGRGRVRRRYVPRAGPWPRRHPLDHPADPAAHLSARPGWVHTPPWDWPIYPRFVSGDRRKLVLARQPATPIVRYGLATARRSRLLLTDGAGRPGMEHDVVVRLSDLDPWSEEADKTEQLLRQSTLVMNVVVIVALPRCRRPDHHCGVPVESVAGDGDKQPPGEAVPRGGEREPLGDRPIIVDAVRLVVHRRGPGWREAHLGLVRDLAPSRRSGDRKRSRRSCGRQAGHGAGERQVGARSLRSLSRGSRLWAAVRERPRTARGRTRSEGHRLSLAGPRQRSPARPPGLR